MGLLSNIIGTFSDFFRIGKSGIRLKNSSGTLQIKNAGDSAYASVDEASLKIGGTEVIDSSRVLKNITLPSHTHTSADITDGIDTTIDFFDQKGHEHELIFVNGILTDYTYTP